MLDRSRIVGLPTSRIDGALKVTGQAKYAAEHFEPGMLFGHVALATVATGRIVALDLRAAERVPGVVKIYTHENRPKAAYRDSKWKDAVALPGHPFRPLESDRVLFDGQPVALVVAETPEAARQAAALIHAHYTAGKAHTDIVAEQRNSYEPPVARMKQFLPPPPRGDAAAAFAAAPHRISADYALLGEHHNPMELFAATARPRAPANSPAGSG